ncbi:hypothetical protein ZWY2020_059967 [Hordeum vulgare]|nr:hypothetical protein ZWY2020_059967 [Hordeum vulgare]
MLPPCRRPSLLPRGGTRIRPPRDISCSIPAGGTRICPRRRPRSGSRPRRRSPDVVGGHGAGGRARRRGGRRRRRGGGGGGGGRWGGEAEGEVDVGAASVPERARKDDFICLERVKGSLVNILAGLEVHAGVFSIVEQKRIVDYVYGLQEMGKRGELGGEPYTLVFIDYCMSVV